MLLDGEKKEPYNKLLINLACSVCTKLDLSLGVQTSRSINRKLCLFVFTLSLFAGSRTVQCNISMHSIPHSQPRNRVPKTLTAPIGHVDNLFSVDHKVPDVKTGYHCGFTISLISFIQVCDCEDSAACAQERRKCDLKARSWNS